MTLSKEQIDAVKEVLRNSLRRKFQDYKPEPAAMPFHTRLLGKDRMALFSFIHSLNTNFGTTIFEPVALALAKGRFKVCQAHATAGDSISGAAQSEIQRIMDSLATADSSPDKADEIKKIRAVCQKGAMKKVKLTKVDIFLESKDGRLYLFDLKTAKPNAGGFKEFKRTLLEWAAALLASDPSANVHTIIAIPYNPYEPQPYNRWTIRGMLDIKNELMVAEEFWDFLGGKGAYLDILKCFEEVGIELRPEIDNYFNKFNRS